MTPGRPFFSSFHCVILLSLQLSLLRLSSSVTADSSNLYLFDMLVDDVIAGHPLHDRWQLMAQRTFELSLPPSAQCNKDLLPSFQVAAFRPDLLAEADTANWLVVDVRTIRESDCIDVPANRPWRNRPQLTYYITGSSDLPFCDGAFGRQTLHCGGNGGGRGLGAEARRWTAGKTSLALGFDWR
jgi:hypothetical protein